MSLHSGSYEFHRIEAKWQQFWEENKTFKAFDCDSSRPKYYVLDMFPYPSGQGLHVGHPEGYTASDIVTRYKRMKGFNVLHPMGWDAFGLPAEQYAVKTGTAPEATTKKNIDNMRKQIKSLGFSYDWDREVNTTDPHYFKWTQWVFLKFFNSYFDEAEQKARPIDQLPVPEGLSEDEKRNEPKELAETKKDLSELVNMIKLQYEAEERLSAKSDQVIKNGGKLGVPTIIQIDATRNIAFAAALFASSGILLGISSAILAFTK